MATIERDGTTIYYEVTGSGPPVVLMHSFLCSGEMWGPQIDPLSAQYKVVNIDMRGHGKSGHAETPFDLHDLVEDVVAVLDREGVDRACWAGLSIGGMIALRAALTAPHRVGALALLDTHAGSESFVNTLKSSVTAPAARLFGMTPVVAVIIPMFFCSHTRKNDPALVAQWKAKIRALHVPSVLNALHALRHRESLVARLGEIGVPALVIVGDQDTALPPAFSREIAAAMPDASLVEVPDAGHLTTLEQPDAVNEAMLEFLGRHWRA